MPRTKNKLVKDLMLSLNEYATIHQDRTIAEALLALQESQLGLTNDRHYHRAVLVLDDAGEVVGKLSHWSILRKLEPKFLNVQERAMLAKTGVNEDSIKDIEEGLSHLFGTVTALCEKAALVKARDAMVPVGESINENEPLIAAIHQLVVTHVQSMLVTREGKTVGILRLADVFQEVASIIKAFHRKSKRDTRR